MRPTTLVQFGAALLALTAFAARPAAAQDAAAEQLFTRLSDKSLEKILVKLDIPFERKQIDTDGKKLVFYHVKLKTYKATLVNHSSSLQFVSGGFKTVTNQDVSLERMNEWNQRRRHSRGFVDRNGYAVLEADLDFYGGTNQQIITEWIRLYTVSINDFSNFTR